MELEKVVCTQNIVVSHTLPNTLTVETSLNSHTTIQQHKPFEHLNEDNNEHLTISSSIISSSFAVIVVKVILLETMIRSFDLSNTKLKYICK